MLFGFVAKLFASAGIYFLVRRIWRSATYLILDDQIGTTTVLGVRFNFGALFFFAGRIANPPWGAPLRSRIHKSGGLAMIAPILKRTLICR
jgi:hypothetical protein